MNPFPQGYLFELPELFDAKEMLILRVYLTMKIVWLKNGGIGYCGNVINLYQNITTIIKILEFDVRKLPNSRCEEKV